MKWLLFCYCMQSVPSRSDTELNSTKCCSNMCPYQMGYFADFCQLLTFLLVKNGLTLTAGGLMQ